MEGSVKLYIEGKHQVWPLNPIWNMDKVSQQWIWGGPSNLKPHRVGHNFGENMAVSSPLYSHG